MYNAKLYVEWVVVLVIKSQFGTSPSDIPLYYLMVCVFSGAFS